MKANLFSFHVYLRQDGNIELQKESVRPDELQKEMDAGVPDYDGALRSSRRTTKRNGRGSARL